MRNWAENQITLVLIRHGATKANKEHRYLGKTDEALSKEGEQELADCKDKQIYPMVDCLFSSPMKRCLQTAQILYPEQKPRKIMDWEEMDFGAFEGKNYIELKDDKRYQEWIDSNGTLPFPEGESREEFILRCDKGFQKMIAELWQITKMQEVKTIGMIVHGGTIMALLSRYHGGEYFDYQVKNARGYICTVEDWKNSPVITDVENI